MASSSSTATCRTVAPAASPDAAWAGMPRQRDAGEGADGGVEEGESWDDLKRKYTRKAEGSDPTLMEQFEMLEQKKKLLQRLKRGERAKEVDPSQKIVAQAAANALKGDGHRKKKRDKKASVELFPERGEAGRKGGGERGGGGGGGGVAARGEMVDDVVGGHPEASPVKKEVSWEGYGLESVWKGEKDATVDVIWGQVMHRSHDIGTQERMAALKKLEVKISKQAKTVTAIADMDLTRSRIMAKLHRDTDPLKRGTSQLLKMSPTVLKSIKSNLADKKHGADAGKGQKHIAPAPARGQMQGRGHPSGVADEEEEEEEEARMKRFVDVDSLVTPRRNVRRWERELVGLIKDKKKREEVASGAKTERRMQAFKPPSKEEMKRLSKQATVDLGYSSNEDEEGEEAASAGLGMSRRRKSHGRRRSSVSIVLEDEGEDACQGKGGGGAAGRVDKVKNMAGFSVKEVPLHPEEHEMGLDFKTSVKCVRSVNNSLNEVTQKYNFRYLKLETMIGKGGRDEAFDEVGGKHGLYDRPMMRDFQKMQAALEQSGKSIRKLRVTSGGLKSLVPPKVFNHPPFAPDLIEANKANVFQGSLARRIPKLLLQCTEKTSNELSAVERRAMLEIERLKNVEKGLLRRDARIVEAAIENQMQAVEKMGRRWLTALVLGLASRILIAKAFKVIHHRKVVQPKAASAIQKTWRDWHKKRLDLQVRAMGLVISQVMRRRAVKRRHKSCDIIVRMLNETAFLSKINRAIRRFRMYVVMVQRHVRAWLECCRIENKTLHKLVEKAEKAELMAAVKAKRLALRSERDEFEKAQMSDDYTSPALARPTDMFEGNEPYQVVQWPQLQVPARVRAEIVQATCLRRRKQYMLDLRAYDEERKRFKMLRQQFIMFTARVHQFAQDVKGTDSHEEGDKVSRIVLHELEQLSHVGKDGGSSKTGMPREQAELLKKLLIPNRPVYPQGLDDAEAQALARMGMEASGSTMLESLATWYRAKCGAAEVRKAAARASNEGPASPRSETSPTPRRPVIGMTASSGMSSASDGRDMPISTLSRKRA